jgi:uncharacterized membrane protein
MKAYTLARMFLFCLMLLLIRLVKTDHFSFFFLIWNLFLAWLPCWFINLHKRARTPVAKGIVISLTILFLPNAPYILTDLFHLTKNLAAPMWFDLLLILSFAVLGMAFFILAFKQLMLVLSELIKSSRNIYIVKYLILLSTGYGIYLGRYLRFNSWDVISNPFELVMQIFQSLFDPACFKETFAVTFAFSIFLYLILEISNSMSLTLEKTQHDIH